MAVRWGMLRTRVARRILLLFIVGAIVPVAFMAAASFRAMNGQLRKQSEERLVQIARNARQAIMQQLVMTEAGLWLAAEALRQGSTPASASIPPSITALVSSQDGDAPESLLGDPFPVPAILQSERDHLARGRTMVLKANAAARPYMVAVVALPGPGVEDRLLWAALAGDSIWGSADRFASGGTIRDFCVLVGSDPLYCRSGLTFAADAYLAAGDRSTSGTMLVNTTQGSMAVGWAELYLEAAFRSPSLRVLVAESTADLYSVDLSLLRYSFGVALLLGILVVVLLASVQIRRTMTPLEALAEGTHRLAQGEMGARVEVTSRDEFGLLARSFNAMAGRLQGQFQTLEAGRAVDRAVLSAMDTDGVVDALLDRFASLVPCRAVAVLIVKPQSLHRAWLYWLPREGEARSERDVSLSRIDVEWLEGASAYRVAATPEDRPPFLVDAIAAIGRHPLTALPMISQGKLLGAVVFEALRPEIPSEELVAPGRQVADQATVALDAVRLVGELEETNWGTLRALARAIDAKSRWTAGHSERVTELSLALGRRLGLSKENMDTLHRGALLHDVGKIGVPAHILHSPETLTPEEWVQVHQHPVIGGRILEPIRSFKPALPIVLQHHERWDGKGYPNGLSGDQIHPLARALAVADTFDAMASARPYRAALDPGVVLAEIQDGAGTQFEPAATRAFLEMMAERGIVPRKAPRRRSRG